MLQILLLALVLVAGSAAGGPPAASARPALADQLMSWKVVNYYPSAYSWDGMWTHFDASRVDADLGRIRSTFGATVVRINLQAETFGYPTPTAERRADLATVIGLADAHGLQVQLTLFDWFSDFADVAGSKSWTTALLAPYRDDDRIAYVDLNNEVNLRTGFRSTVTDWVRQLAPHVKGLLGTIPVTASILDSADDARFLKQAGVGLDFYDLHFYGLPYLAEARFREVRDAVAPAPLFVGEFGYSTLPANAAMPHVPASASAQEAMQVHVFRTIVHAAQRVGLPFGTAWTYIDFEPATGPPLLTQEPRQAYFGLLRADGTLKPGGATIAAIFAGASIDASFNSGFEAEVLDGAGATVPAQWRIAAATNGSFSRDTVTRRTGSASARIGSTTASSGAVPAFYMAPVEAIRAGRSYRLQAWAAGVNATGHTTIALSWYDRDFNWLGQNESAALESGTTPWTLMEAEATAPAGAGFVEMWLKSDRNTGHVNFDDVSFVDTTLGTPPVISSVSVTPASAGTSAVLSAVVVASDPDGGPITIAYQWSRNGTDITGATAATLSLAVAGNGNRGDAIRVRATASDDALASLPATSSAVIVVDTAPTATVALTPTNPTTNTVLKATATSTDIDVDPITLTYRWRVDGILRRTRATTLGTDTFNLGLPGNGDSGQTVSVTVTPDDGTLTGTGATARVTVATPAVLADDPFSRTVVNGWGTAATGGVYTLKGTSADFDVNGSAGTILLSSPGANRSATLAAVAALDVDLTFRAATDKVSVGGQQYLYGIVRRVNATNAYRAKIRLAPGGAVYVQASTLLNNVETPIGGEARVPGLTRTAAGQIRVRIQAQGANPTTIRIRAWPATASEPTTWHYTTTNGAAPLQTDGAIGVQAYLAATTTNAPVTATVDDIHATAIAK
jgi:hypothetical protein